MSCIYFIEKVNFYNLLNLNLILSDNNSKMNANFSSFKCMKITLIVFQVLVIIGAILLINVATLGIYNESKLNENKSCKLNVYLLILLLKSLLMLSKYCCNYLLFSLWIHVHSCGWDHFTYNQFNWFDWLFQGAYHFDARL